MGENKQNSNLIKISLFLFVAICYIALYFAINPISESITFLKKDYSQIILYFIYFIFLYMIFFFYLKQFNLYLALFSSDKEDNIIKVDTKDNSIWKEIILKIESTRHISILSKIKDLDIENEINFPKYNRKYDFNLLFLHKVREFIVLFEIILEKLKHRGLDESSEENKEQEFIQKKLYELYQYKYSFKMKLILIKLLYYIIPYIILMFILEYISIEIEATAFYKFFWGLGILIFIMPILLIIDNFFKYLKISFFKCMEIDFSKSVLLDVSIQIVSTLIMTMLMVWGFHYLDSMEPSNIHKFHHVFVFFKEIIFSTEITVGTLFEMYVPNYILISKIIIAIMASVIFLNIVNVFIKEYDQFFYEQKIKRYLLPPELLKVVAFFFIFISYITYNYVMVSAYPYERIDINTTKQSIDRNVTQFVAMENIAKAIEEKASFEDILPFGLFLALFGTLLSISSRDIMGNYFAGLSMKMNIPYEVGDRVKIENSEILEVLEIGIRNDKFYEISSNSIISIPHTKLSTGSIKNYTHPTLDYREKLTIYAKDRRDNAQSTPREAEKVLLVSAFVNTGVKLPKIDQNILKEIKEIDFNIFEEYKDKDHSKIENELDKEESKIAEQIDNTWKELSKINKEKLDKNNKKYFFKNLFIENFQIDNVSKETNNRTLLSIKKALIAIIASVIEYQEKIEKEFSSKSDTQGVRRKYMIFDEKNDEKIKELGDIVVNISFYYYMLSNRLWELKEEQTTFSQKRKIDKAMTQILNVPRVTSMQELNDGNNYWKTTLSLTLELSEQCDETLHHINMYVDKIWNIFLEENDKNNL